MKKPNLSLKRLREILGKDGEPMTQRQFAALVGVSLPLIKAMEAGQVKLAYKLFHKIEVATGAMLGRVYYDRPGIPWESFSDGKILGIPLGNGRTLEKYTRAHFDYHRSLFPGGKQAADEVLSEIQPMIAKLVYAAAKPGVAGIKDRLPAVRASIHEWMQEANQTFNLGVKLWAAS